jgi:hypothetical protein
MLRRLRLPLWLTIALLPLGPASAEAQIQGCYVPSSGTVYVVGAPFSPSACATGHIPVNLQGPPGLQGPSGIATVTVVQKDTTFGPGSAGIILICPPNTIALSSGYSITPGGSVIGLSGSFRVGDAWAFNLFNVSSPPVTATYHLELYCGSP